jgi:hypothetical protein
MTSLPDLKPFRPQPRTRPQQIITHHRPKQWGCGHDWYGGESPKSCSRDDLSDVALMGKACDVWYDAWHNGICLTPPYISMKNWYKRLHLEPTNARDGQDEDEIDFVAAVESVPEFMSEEEE